MELYIAESPGRGRGVFAARAFQEREIIEVCPVILVQSTQKASIDRTCLYDYYFSWDEEGAAICLGFGSLYNHSYRPNAHYHKEFLTRHIRFTALTPIREGEEITVNYTGRPDGKEAIWFVPLPE